MPDFDEGVDHVNRETRCYCSRIPVEEKKRFERYEFGTHLCSKSPPGSCGIVKFIQGKSSEIERILKTLEHIPADKKTRQLQEAENFIRRVLQDPSSAVSLDPCYKVGDLLIALESCSATAFYTLNGKESQYLCRVLDQDLIVRPLNPEHPDIECKRGDHKWQEF
jgi:hypothetical protein